MCREMIVDSRVEARSRRLYDLQRCHEVRERFHGGVRGATAPLLRMARAPPPCLYFSVSDGAFQLASNLLFFHSQHSIPAQSYSPNIFQRLRGNTEAHQKCQIIHKWFSFVRFSDDLLTTTHNLVDTQSSHSSKAGHLGVRDEIPIPTTLAHNERIIFWSWRDQLAASLRRPAPAPQEQLRRMLPYRRLRAHGQAGRGNVWRGSSRQIEKDRCCCGAEEDHHAQ